MIAIRKYRKQMHWTQAILAEKSGVAKTTVSMWETGDRKPDIVMLKKLTGIFGCTADDLLAPIQIDEKTGGELERVHIKINRTSFWQILSTTALKALAIRPTEVPLGCASMPAVFRLVFGKIMLENPHVYFM